MCRGPTRRLTKKPSGTEQTNNQVEFQLDDDVGAGPLSLFVSGLQEKVSTMFVKPHKDAFGRLFEMEDSSQPFVHENLNMKREADLSKFDSIIFERVVV